VDAGLCHRDRAVVRFGQCAGEQSQPHRPVASDYRGFTRMPPVHAMVIKQAGVDGTPQQPAAPATLRKMRRCPAAVQRRTQENHAPRRKRVVMFGKHAQSDDAAQRVTDEMQGGNVEFLHELEQPGGVFRDARAHRGVAEAMHAKACSFQPATQQEQLRACHPQAVDEDDVRACVHLAMFSMRPSATFACSATSCGTRIWLTTWPSTRFSSVQARCCGSMRNMVEHMHTMGDMKCTCTPFSFISLCRRLTRLSSVPTSQRVPGSALRRWFWMYSVEPT